MKLAVISCMFVISLLEFSPLAAGPECTGTLCLCERGKQQPVCLSGRVCAGMYGDALAEMEASAGPDYMGHTPHHGLHLHL